MSALLLSLLAFGAIWGYLFWWNTHVYHVRMRLIQQVSAAAKRDIDEWCAWHWRYDEMERVTYTEMFLRPWRRPLSLYDDLGFLDPATRRGPLTEELR